MSGQDIQPFIVENIEDSKGLELIEIDVRGISSITDKLIICSGTSNRHVMAIADNLVQAAKLNGNPPLNVSGEQSAEWIVVDFGDVIVHIMQPDIRQLYQLERLWGER